MVSLALEHFHFQHQNQEIFPQVVHSNGQRSGPHRLREIPVTQASGDSQYMKNTSAETPL